jgi:hypothetical protein
MKTINVNYIYTGTFNLGDDDLFLCDHESLSVWYNKEFDEINVECDALDCTGITDNIYDAEVRDFWDNYDDEWEAEYWRGIGE